jgi:hypothetical protein
MDPRALKAPFLQETSKSYQNWEVTSSNPSDSKQTQASGFPGP